MCRLLTVTAFLAAFAIGSVATATSLADSVHSPSAQIDQYKAALADEIMDCFIDGTTPTCFVRHYPDPYIEAAYTLIDGEWLVQRAEPSPAEQALANQVLSCEDTTELCTIENPHTGKTVLTFSRKADGQYQLITGEGVLP